MVGQYVRLLEVPKPPPDGGLVLVMGCGRRRALFGMLLQMMMGFGRNKSFVWVVAPDDDAAYMDTSTACRRERCRW